MQRGGVCGAVLDMMVEVLPELAKQSFVSGSLVSGRQVLSGVRDSQSAFICTKDGLIQRRLLSVPLKAFFLQVNRKITGRNHRSPEDGGRREFRGCIGRVGSFD